MLRYEDLGCSRDKYIVFLIKRGIDEVLDRSEVMDGIEDLLLCAGLQQRKTQRTAND